MKKLALILALAMIATVSFAGCGGSSSSDTGSDTGESSVVDESSEESSAEESSAEESSADADASAASLSGTYTVSSITLDGVEQTYDDYCKAQAAAQGLSEGDEGYDAAISALQISYVFVEDGTVSVTMAGVESAGTYTYDGDSTVTVTFNGTDAALVYDSSANTLTSTDASTGTSMTFAAAE